MTRRIYKSAIVGCGRIGCFLDQDPKRKGTLWTHAAAYRACPRTGTGCLGGRGRHGAIRARRRGGASPTPYTNLTSLLKRKDIDILSICTRSDSHAALFKQAVTAQVPAIWCEKPMAATLRQPKT